MKVILLNGPPGSGKDTAGYLIHRRFPRVVVRKFATALKLATHALYQVPADFLHAGAYETCKNDPHEHFFGLSPREAYIEVSEQMVKPWKGKDFFGRVLVQRLRRDQAQQYALVAITDSGFGAEAVPVIQHVGAANTLLLRLHRPGCDFKGDSRGYLKFPSADAFGLADSSKVRQIDLDNDQDLAVFEERLVAAVSLWLDA